MTWSGNIISRGAHQSNLLLNWHLQPIDLTHSWVTMPGLCILTALVTCPKMPRLSVQNLARTTRSLRRAIMRYRRHKREIRKKYAIKLVRKSHLNLLRDIQSQQSRTQHRRYNIAEHLGSQHKDTWRRGRTLAFWMQKVNLVCQACKPVVPWPITMQLVFIQAKCRGLGTRASNRGVSLLSSPFQSGRLQEVLIRRKLVHCNHSASYQHSCCRGHCQRRTSVSFRTGLCFPSQLNTWAHKSIRPRNQRPISSKCMQNQCNLTTCTPIPCSLSDFEWTSPPHRPCPRPVTWECRSRNNYINRSPKTTHLGRVVLRVLLQQRRWSMFLKFEEFILMRKVLFTIYIIDQKVSVLTKHRKYLCITLKSTTIQKHEITLIDPQPLLVPNKSNMWMGPTRFWPVNLQICYIKF